MLFLDSMDFRLSPRSSIAVVVFPPVSLMADQSNSAFGNGISAAVWTTDTLRPGTKEAQLAI